LQKKILNDEMKSRINIDFDDTTLIPQLIGVNNCNLREIEGYINVEVDSNGSIINLYGKRKDCLVAKEIIEKSYIKLKNYKANNVEFNEFSIDTDIKNVISKKLKNYPLDKNIDNLTISTWKKNILSNRFYDLLLFLFVVLVVTLVSGLIPKALVINNPESAALRLTSIFDAVRKAMNPIVKTIEFFASACLGLFNLNNKWDSLNSGLSAGELETLIETDNVTGLKPDEKNNLEGVFALKDTQVKEVMIPRSEMVTLPKNITFSELMKQVDKTRHARFFVIDESLDDVLGVLDLRYLAKPISKGEMEADTLLEPFLLPVTKIIETCSLAEIFPIVREYNPFLLVVDEHGGTEGLITAADLNGEIVGEEMLNNRIYSDMRMLDNFSKKWSIA